MPGLLSEACRSLTFVHSEPPLVYRRASVSNVRLLFHWYSRFHALCLRLESQYASSVSFEISIPMVSSIVFSSPCLVLRAQSPRIHLSGHCCAMPCRSVVQVDRKDGGDHTRQRSTTTKRKTVRPPLLPGINPVPGSYSSFTQEPLNS